MFRIVLFFHSVNSVILKILIRTLFFLFPYPSSIIPYCIHLFTATATATVICVPFLFFLFFPYPSSLIPYCIHLFTATATATTTVTATVHCNYFFFFLSSLDVLILNRDFANFKFILFMDIQDKKESRSFKNFLKNPLIKSDSKAFQYSGLGIQLTVTILVFLFIGVWLDKTFNTQFIFTLILTFVGFGGGFYSFYLTVKGMSESEKKKSNIKPIEKR